MYPGNEEHPEFQESNCSEEDIVAVTCNAEFDFSVSTIDELIANAAEFLTQLLEAKKTYEARKIGFVDIIDVDLD